MPNALLAASRRLRRLMAGSGAWARAKFPLLARTPPLAQLIELAARVGYGARGFVYLSVGALVLMAGLDVMGDAVGSRGAVSWLAARPFGRIWLILLGLGLWAFVGWRVLQAVFDADREGTDPKAWAMRAGQAASGVFYGLLASSVFELLDELERRPQAEDVAENQRKAEQLLALPWGDWLLAGVGLTILAVGVGNIVRGFRADFSEELACSPKVCRRVTPLARAGYVARGFAYLPLAVFVVLAGLEASAAEVTSFGAGLDALESRPGGGLVVTVTACGLMAFGAFAFVEARWRRIRTPKAVVPD